MAIRKAEKRQLKLRLGLIGPSGSGKTYSALAMATVLAAGGKIGVIDTERNSAELYADIFSFDVDSDFQAFSPAAYVEKIAAFAKEGYPVLVIDSLSHAWSGVGGALEMVDNIGKRNKGNSFGAWREVTPVHNRMVDAILTYPGHVIVTLRSKVEYVQEKDERTGKTVVRKVGMQPVQREGMEYEFTVVGDMDQENNLIITKTRCHYLAGGVYNKPGREPTETLMNWLNDGGEEMPQQPQTPTAEPAHQHEPTEREKLLNAARREVGNIPKEDRAAWAMEAFGVEMAKIPSLSDDVLREKLAAIEASKQPQGAGA